MDCIDNNSEKLCYRAHCYREHTIESTPCRVFLKRCAIKREREREHVCVCVCRERERERERKRERENTFQKLSLCIFRR